ncbi:MAG TPA: phospholipase D-like domain-containing protein, partial [Gemmatimonadales bacterium]
RADATGRRFADALIERARAGVRVRVLTDWIGSVSTRASYWRRLREAGISVRKFNPPQLLRLRRNLTRDHRKILVVDGKTAITGGLCIGDEWAGRPTGGRQPWRDSAVMIEGPAAAAMDRAFDGVWRTIGPALEEDELLSDAPVQGSSAIRVVAGEPGGVRASRATELLLAGAAERIWITDAYLVAPPGIYQSMLDAARGGVDVRLLVPGTSDLKHVRNWTRMSYRDMLRVGIRIYEWRGAMLHAKTIVVDGRWVRVGSSNLNLSSLVANYEIDVVADDPGLAQIMEAQFRRDTDRSSEIRLRTEPRRGFLRPRNIFEPEPVLDAPSHRPGLRERRGRAVVAVQHMLHGARRTVLLPYSIVLTVIGVLFLSFPRTMGVIFAVMSLWLALTAWLDSRSP